MLSLLRRMFGFVPDNNEVSVLFDDEMSGRILFVEKGRQQGPPASIERRGSPVALGDGEASASYDPAQGTVSLRQGRLVLALFKERTTGSGWSVPSPAWDRLVAHVQAGSVIRVTSGDRSLDSDESGFSDDRSSDGSAPPPAAAADPSGPTPGEAAAVAALAGLGYATLTERGHADVKDQDLNPDPGQGPGPGWQPSGGAYDP